jgi:hypothetical protein
MVIWPSSSGIPSPAYLRRSGGGRRAVTGRAVRPGGGTQRLATKILATTRLRVGTRRCVPRGATLIATRAAHNRAGRPLVCPSWRAGSHPAYLSFPRGHHDFLPPAAWKRVHTAVFSQASTLPWVAVEALPLTDLPRRGPYSLVHVTGKAVARTVPPRQGCTYFCSAITRALPLSEATSLPHLILGQAGAIAPRSPASARVWPLSVGQERHVISRASPRHILRGMGMRWGWGWR